MDKSNDITEKHTIERTYYYNLGEDGIFANDESMLAYLLDESVVFVSNIFGNGKVTLNININDYFAPGSDSEDFPSRDISKIFDMYRKDGCKGVAQYVADKRGIPNKHWRDK